MGLGDSMASGWGQPPANGPSWGSSPGNNNSSSGWTSSTSSTNTTNHWGNNGHQTNGETITESSSLHSAYPKPSWAQAVCINRGPNQTQVPNYSGNNCSNSSRSHLENSSDPKYPVSSEHEVKHHHDSSRLPTEVLVADNWGHAVSLCLSPAYQV